MRLKHLMGGTASAIVLAGLASGAAYAGQPPAEPTVFGELVVTAQKREQRLQDVPVVVTVVGEQALQDAGVTDIRELTVLTPGLIVTSTSSETSTSARIRGVGTVGDNPGLEASVGVVIDGVYRPRNGVSFGDLGELEQVEVLKGPQGTVFGKNTTAGVINIISADPSFNGHVAGEVTGSNFSGMRANVSMTGPLVGETVAGRLYVGYGDRDGFLNITRGLTARPAKDQDLNYWTARGQLLFLPNDDLDIRVIVDYTSRDENCCGAVQLVNGPFNGVLAGTAGAANVPGGPYTLSVVNPTGRNAYMDSSSHQRITDQGISAELNWDAPWFGGAQLTSITSYRDWNARLAQDADYTSANLLFRVDDGSHFRIFRQATQEVRLAGQNDRLTWLVGGTYGTEDLNTGESINEGTDLAPYLNSLALALGQSSASYGGTTPFAAHASQRDRHSQDSSSYALFTNNDFKITDQLTATLGLRYTSEDKDRVSNYTGAGTCTAGAYTATQAGPSATARALYGGYLCASANDVQYDALTQTESITDRATTGTAKLAWRLNPQMMAYVSYARGYKASGFNLYRQRAGALNGVSVPLPDPTTAFLPETVDSYELGWKSQYDGGKFVFNATAFYQKYRNFQLNAFDGVDFNVQNIPTVVSQGVDVDVAWQTPINGLSIQTGVTYADSRYGPEAFPGSTTGLIRLPGNRVSFAPFVSASLAVTYEVELDNLLLRTNVSAKHTSRYNTGSDLGTAKVQPDLTLFNALISLGAQDDKWALELWARNLSNETYRQVAFDSTFQTGGTSAFLGAPRTVGVTLRVKR